MKNIDELIKEYQKDKKTDTDKNLTFKKWLLFYKEEEIKHNDVNYIMKIEKKEVF